MFSMTLVTLLLETLCALELDEESHGKLTTKSLFWAPKGGRTRFGTIQKRLLTQSSIFLESFFTSVLNYEILFTPNSKNFSARKS